MKHTVITVDENNIPKITLEELKQMLEDAYEEGFKDGKNQTPPIIIHPQPYEVKPWWIYDSTTNVITTTESPSTYLSTSCTSINCKDYIDNENVTVSISMNDIF